ncbi:DUF4833 domain-containing protein [Mangrovibacterium sp.]|uniref:DUF4833 domain-containing protein n=1 Tax=Mangrovibacterium sp. TaxID=1961364 RepID=UPI00356A49CC
MNYFRRKPVTILILILIVQTIDVAGRNKTSKKEVLFKIERSRDADEIYYEVRVTEDGHLDQKNPIDIYWIRHTKNGAVEPLTRIQRKLSYGLNFLDITNDQAHFRFAAFSKVMTLQKTADGRYHVFTRVNGQNAEVERIFIQFDGGSFLLPKISRVELHVFSAETNKHYAELIHP